ncbi:MAG: M48 family metalloprotease [Hyphomicrobiaceae bacterium]
MLSSTRRRHPFGVAIAAALMWGIGLVAASSGASAQQLIYDDEIENLLDDYARPIFKAAGLNNGHITMRIINDPTFNAFVLDGRNVFIHTGTLMQADTPNQVIGVIAHEVGHIDGAHLAALRAEMQRVQTGMILTRVIGIAAAVLARNSAAAFAADDPWLKTFLARRRQQESSADQAGVRFLTRTHQSGRGMLETFEKLGIENRAYGVNPYLLSHPTERTRIAHLRDAVQRSPYYNTKDSPALQLRHDLVRAKLRGFTLPAQDVVNLYRNDNSLPARYARAIAANCSGNCTRAIGQIDELIKAAPQNPYFWELKGHVYAREGKSAQAIPALRQTLKLGGNRSHLVKTELARMLVSSSNPAYLDEAIRLLEVMLDTNEEASGYSLLARAYAAKGREAEAEVAMAYAHLQRGNNKQAIIFAKRAQRKLKVGSRAWRKADDIIKTTPAGDR